MMVFQKFVKDGPTENDGESYCLIRVVDLLVFPSVFIFHAAAVWMLIKKNKLDLSSVGAALITMCAVVAIVFEIVITMNTITDGTLQ